MDDIKMVLVELEKVNKLHDEAMDLAEAALLADLRRDVEKSKKLRRQAYVKEAQVARMLDDELAFEPSRSVLYRSAASLALLCEEFDEAEKLISAGLAGNPPAEIAEELRELRR